jgi:hypothetical protein
LRSVTSTSTIFLQCSSFISCQVPDRIDHPWTVFHIPLE